MPELWVANTGGNNVKRFAIYLYQITPALPAGLSYDFVTGSITGVPTTTAAVQTYTIITQNSIGTTTITISFSIDPPGPVTNAVGTHTSTAVQSDGLTINYFDPNNCAPMVQIADSLGGTVVGNVTISQTVYPNLSKNIRKIRKEKGLTQADCGVDERTVRRIENENFNPSYLTLIQISKGLGASIAELLDFLK